MLTRELGLASSILAANLRSPVDLPFAHRQRVRFGETDLQGVVYYANYLVFAEVGRMAYLRALGIALPPWQHAIERYLASVSVT